MATREYTVLLQPERDTGGFSATVPALPGCTTQGRTLGECIERVEEAITLYLEELEAHGEEAPMETERPQAIIVRVDV